jgi:hypothetical protein
VCALWCFLVTSTFSFFGYVNFFFFYPSLASLSASLFPIIFLCAFTFCVFIKVIWFVKCFVIPCNIILSG